MSMYRETRRETESHRQIAQAAAWRTSDVVCSIAFALLASQSVAMLTSEAAPSRMGSDLSGLFFIVVAIFYRGSVGTWWGFFAPACVLLLFAPVARWESLEVVTGGGLLRASIVPGLSFVGGSLLATIRDTKSGALDAGLELRRLNSRGLRSIMELKALGNEIKDLSQAMKNNQMVIGDVSEVSWDLGSALEPSEVLSHGEILRVLSSEVERFRQSHPSLRVSLLAPQDVPVPLAVRGERRALEVSLRNLLEQAASSIGSNKGVVRVTLRPGLRSVTMTIEDNGRGLNEEMITKLEQKGTADLESGARLGLAEIRKLIEGLGWNLEIQARLGVGARITVELPRVDSLSSGARVASQARLNLDKAAVVKSSPAMSENPGSLRA